METRRALKSARIVSHYYEEEEVGDSGRDTHSSECSQWLVGYIIDYQVTAARISAPHAYTPTHTPPPPVGRVIGGDKDFTGQSALRRPADLKIIIFIFLNQWAAATPPGPPIPSLSFSPW